MHHTTAVALILALWAAGCCEPAGRDLILATTTSTYDSGLLDELVPDFERQSKVKVKVIAVGSGQALKMGRLGEADVLLVHSPEAEQELMGAGCGLRRRPVMHNSFILVGPTADPAAVEQAGSAVEALRKIKAAAAPFVSRGDDSGTHARERKLWSLASIEPAGQWYIESGQGMAATLRLASEKQTYTLTDQSTFLALGSTIDLEPLVTGDPALFNRYHVIEVSPKCGPRVNHREAKLFADFLLEEETQRKIGRFGLETVGEALFVPDALAQ